MKQDRLLFVATFLSGASALIAALYGIGAGLSESTDGVAVFWVLAGLSGAAAILCDKARGGTVPMHHMLRRRGPRDEGPDPDPSDR